MGAAGIIYPQFCSIINATAGKKPKERSMSSLFDKITTFVNAQVNDFLGRNPKSPLARIQLNAAEAEKNPRPSVQALRQRLEEAIAYEDELEAKIETLMRAALDLDQQVDRRLHSGDELAARRLQVQLNMKQRQLTIAESELRDHRVLTQRLMQEMTALEMALDSQDRRAETAAASSSGKSQPGSISVPVEGLDSVQRPSVFDAAADKLNKTRSSLENLLNNSPVPAAPGISKQYEKFDIVDEAPDPRQPKSKPRMPNEGDMKARLSRLSKPDRDDS